MGHLQLQQVHAFVAVAEELHFGAAASQLHVTQPSVSQQVRSLEKELGVKLFHRSTRTVSLTEAGTAFLGPARRLLDSARLARRSATLSPEDVLGDVSIGYSGACASNALPRLAQAVRSRLPGVKLSFVAGVFSGDAVAHVADGKLDIGFSRLPVSEPNVAHRTYEIEPVVLALPANHRLVGYDTVPLEALVDEDFIAYPSVGGARTRQALDRAAEAAGFRPKIVQEAPDSYTILTLVAAGVGISITEATVQHISFPGVVYRPAPSVFPPIPAIITWNENSISHATEAVLAVAETALPTPAGAISEGSRSKFRPDEFVTRTSDRHPGA